MYESPLVLLAVEYRLPSSVQLVEGPSPSESCREDDDEGPATAGTHEGSGKVFQRADSTEAKVVSCV